MEETMMKRQPKPLSLAYYCRVFYAGMSAAVPSLAEWPRDYYLIALVHAVEPNEVFGLMTQGEHQSKDDLARVHWLRPTRSMMIGDVVENDDGVFRCDRNGWQRL